MCNPAATALEAIGIAKRFGEVSALDGVDLVARHGEIHGLLGANGAGKTTLIRIVLGLVRRDAGRLHVLGHDLVTSPERIPDGVAGIAERAGFYPYLSGRRNLSVLARLDARRATRDDVDRAMARAGLTDVAERRVAGYSTGMRQRLGLAAALLRSPRLLLLDEPTSALDPAGAHAVRALVRDLAADGVAVLWSSHDLIEVEQLCASVTILHGGRVIFSGRVSELRALEADGRSTLQTSDDGGALALASAHPAITVTALADGSGLDLIGPAAASDAFVVALGQRGIAVRRLEPRERSLEDVFLWLTAGPGRS